ncbi:unnamed protein product [Lymnaea stagnalis]|uniref:G-protein coupled receptors family 1 profile domain-containing protein n=1 Tax=Lymnaea stagnalis TaxID=6523 RepID=A0AAV2IJW7_LYMST
MVDSSYDRDAFKTANRSLVVIFMILILLTNSWLIVINVSKCDFMHKPKAMTILSLAIGDVFVALLSLLVYTMIWFGAYGPETLTTTSNIYMPYLITFVYGLGLMTLGLEIAQHDRICCMSEEWKFICSIAACCIPWILGVIVVLPLGLYNMDSKTLRYSRKIEMLKDLIVVSILLPACGAVITSTCVTVYVRCKVQVAYKQAVRSSPNVVVTLNTHNTTNMDAAVTRHQQTLTDEDCELQQPLMGPPQPYSEQAHGPKSQQQQSSHFCNPLTTEFSAPQSQPHQGRDVYQSGDDVVTSAPVNSRVVTSVAVSTNSTQKPVRLFVISFVYFLLVIPLALYNLADASDLPGVAAHITINCTVFWLNIMRSVVTPLIMYGYSDN